MSIDIFWRIPTHGEPSSHRARTPHRGDWFPGNDQLRGAGVAGGSGGFSYIDYIAEIAHAAEISGFQGGLIPSFPMTDEPWVISSLLARETSSFRFMIPFQPGFLNPVVAARMTASLQRATGGRALYNVITGGGGPAQLWWGDSAGHDDRYTRTTEFLDIVRGVWRGASFSYQGKFYQVEDAGLAHPLSAQDFPEIYFSGSSDAALASASKHADYYLTGSNPSPSCARNLRGCASAPTSWAARSSARCGSTSWRVRPRKKPGPKWPRASPMWTRRPSTSSWAWTAAIRWARRASAAAARRR
jgi:alkanesulfonate monooxygenase